MESSLKGWLPLLPSFHSGRNSRIYNILFRFVLFSQPAIEVTSHSEVFRIPVGLVSKNQSLPPTHFERFSVGNVLSSRAHAPEDQKLLRLGNYPTLPHQINVIKFNNSAAEKQFDLCIELKVNIW